jgi:hypothetical protein
VTKLSATPVKATTQKIKKPESPSARPSKKEVKQSPQKVKSPTKRDQDRKYREVKALLDSYLNMAQPGSSKNAASILDEFDPSKR